MADEDKVEESVEDAVQAEPEQETESVVQTEENSTEVEDPIKVEEDAEASDADSDAGSEKEGTPTAPEKYEAFNIPEGAEVNEDMMSAFSEEARTDGLSQKAAQDRMNMLMRWKDVADKQAQDMWVNLGKQWRQRSSDAGLLKKERVVLANAGIKAADPNGELTGILVSCQLHEHPALLTLFEHFGKSVSSPTEVPESSGDAAKMLSRRAILYPDMMSKES